MATTWRTEAGSGWRIYAANVELDEWTQVQRGRIVDALVPDPYDWKGAKISKAIEPLSEFSIHAENVRAFARILRAAETSRDGKLDRLLAKRTDALGALFARAPKRERKAA